MIDLTRLMFDDGATRQPLRVRGRVITLPPCDNEGEHGEGGPRRITGSYEDTGIDQDFYTTEVGTIAIFENGLWRSNGQGQWAWVSGDGSVNGYIPLAEYAAMNNRRLWKATRIDL